KRSIRSPLGYFVARAKNNLALNAFDCSVCLQSVFPEDAYPNQPLTSFDKASTLKPSSWHCSSSAHRKRCYRCGCYHDRLLVRFRITVRNASAGRFGKDGRFLLSCSDAIAARHG